MTPKIKFAIIGYGHIGKRHAHHILEHAEAAWVAVIDNNPQQFKDVPSDVLRFESIEDFINAHVEVDVVNVCTPNYLHALHCIQLMQAGYHVVCEKPMALSVQACDDMMAAAQTHHKLIFAVKQNRYNPPVKAVKALIDQEVLGAIYVVNVNCFWNRNDYYYQQSAWRGDKEMDGGCLFTQFSHFVDILYYLCGRVHSSKGFIKNFAHQHNTAFEDSGVFVMEAENGALINFNFSTAAYEKNFEGAFTILAEKGVVKIGGQYLNTIEYQNLQNAHIPNVDVNAKANDYGHYQGSMSNHDAVIDNVVQVLKGRETIMTSAAEGREVVRIIEQMYASAQNLN